MTKPNAELAYKVLDHIDAHPDEWDQNDWLAKTRCGTSGCFAGWAVILAGLDVVFEEPDPEIPDYSPAVQAIDADGYSTNIRDAAKNALGIDFTASALFAGSNTREDLGRMVAEVFGPRPGGAA